MVCTRMKHTYSKRLECVLRRPVLRGRLCCLCAPRCFLSSQFLRFTFASLCNTQALRVCIYPSNWCMSLRFSLYPDWHCVPESALSNLSIANLPETQPIRCTCFAVAMQNDGIATSTIMLSKLFESRTSSPAGIWLHESALHATQQQLMTYYGASEPESARRPTQSTCNCVKVDFAGHDRVLVCSLTVSNSHAHATTYAACSCSNRLKIRPAV
jgi:hypothetical protein